MAKLARDGQKALKDAQSLRLRAAWLYYTYGYTQKDIADRLGLARTSVVRLLDEALKRAEVQIWISEGAPELIDLSLKLEDRLELDEAIVVPGEDGADAAAKAVGAALGILLSETIRDGMCVGVGWGRTLTASLATFRPTRRENVKVVSLLGGVVEAALTNPLEFTWRLASQLGAECFLFPAPLLVDSAETRDRLFALRTGQAGAARFLAGPCGRQRRRHRPYGHLPLEGAAVQGPAAGALRGGLCVRRLVQFPRRRREERRPSPERARNVDQPRYDRARAARRYRHRGRSARQSDPRRPQAHRVQHACHRRTRRKAPSGPHRIARAARSTRSRARARLPRTVTPLRRADATPSPALQSICKTNVVEV